MRRILSISLTALLLGGCASMGFTVNKDKLIDTAAFDHKCPRDKVSIVTVDDDGAQGTGRYTLKVCGAHRQYKRAGTMYFDAEKGGPLGNQG